MTAPDKVDVFDLETLRSRVATGWQPSYLFFWGHTSKTRQPGKHLLSQWWPCAFVVEGDRFTTVEHYMMAEKARLFGDRHARERILSTPDPAQAKALGRRIRGFDDEIWKSHRFEIVVRGNLAKFQQSSVLGEWLQDTSEDIIAEASPVDSVWGIGLPADDQRARDPLRWRGPNLLGFALLRVRALLRSRD